ncbi:signal transduction histidine kinase [Paenibacillus endophyticus]|uniref:histidine kinase n=1 Tax=Paenibacillus endophyticus TaxID=1294268 RepID=A0A7W5CCY7_9BACL|nr:HAMP domain-containing sensor histidine kinase [Paenibacillus endophyticus]MBB3155428.1 signal transduction histidine kinase [Paenibacillus endophyticus]
MYWLIGVLASLCLIFATRFYLLRREIKRLAIQMPDFAASARYGQRLYLEEHDSALAKAVLEINRMVDVYENQLRRVDELEQNIRLSITGLSHDLRTPLTSLAGYLQLMEKAPSPEKQQEYLAIILDSVKVLQGLTERFYELTRLELNENSYDIQSLNLEHAVCECFLRFFEEFDRKKIELNIKDAANPPEVCADPMALQRVLYNLIQNLLRYAIGTVTISFYEEGGFHAVKIGNETEIPLPNHIDSIFDRFHTADPSRSSQGTGLGLYISRKLVHGMGGEITAEKDKQMLFIIVKLRMDHNM